MSTSQNDIRLGVLTRPHGVNGGILCRLDHPGNPTVKTPTTGRIGYSDAFTTTRELLRCEPIGQKEMLCHFAGATSREAVEKLVDMAIWLPRGSVEYGDSFATPELIGLEVVDQDEMYLGRIVGILRTAGHPVWEIRNEEYEWLFPAVDEFIRGLDPEKRIIQVELIEGLYEPPTDDSDMDSEEEIDG